MHSITQDRTKITEYAKKYYDLGLSIIPVSTEKTPLIEWKKYQKERPRLSEIATWFNSSFFTGAGIAIVTGEVSGVVVVDFDGEEGLAMMKKLEIGETPIAKTGKGYHVYYKHPGFTCRNFARKRPGMDFRGDGGCAVAPPSLHPSGKYYEWIKAPWEVDFAPCPDWLIEMLNERPKGIADGNQEDVIPEGQRNVFLTSLAGSMRRRGMAPEAIAAALKVENQNRCYPPLPDREVEEIAKSIGRYEPETNAHLPEIDANNNCLPDVSNQAIAALMAANKEDPRLFLHAGPVRIERNDHGDLVAVEIDVDRMRYEMARCANWYIIGKDGVKRRSKPPLDVVRDVLVSPLRFPVLTSIVHVPTFAPDGTLQDKPGYQPATKTFYVPHSGLVIPRVPSKPDRDDIEGAKTFLLDEWLGDFPFASDADRAHALALLLLPFCRSMIDGLTPLHFVEASGQGAGKGLLARTLLSISCDGGIGIIPPPRDEEEIRKAITARLIEGRAAFLIDNVTRLDSAVLSAALTADIWDDRLLGKNKTVRLPIKWVWAATGNNATVSTDIARRTIRIRLTPEDERPWLRRDFRHPELPAWTAKHRGELIYAALTLIQAWVAAGRPEADVTPLGSYENWTRVMGGILEYAGVPGFLGNILEFYELADSESAVWREFLEAWWQRYGDKKVKTSELFPLALEIENFDLGKGATERAQKITFGRKIAAMRDRIFDGKKICSAGIEHKTTYWRLVLIKQREEYPPNANYKN